MLLLLQFPQFLSCLDGDDVGVRDVRGGIKMRAGIYLNIDHLLNSVSGFDFSFREVNFAKRVRMTVSLFLIFCLLGQLLLCFSFCGLRKLE